MIIGHLALIIHSAFALAHFEFFDILPVFQKQHFANLLLHYPVLLTGFGSYLLLFGLLLFAGLNPQFQKLIDFLISDLVPSFEIDIL
ncbi:Uncharacterised protein [Chlamydia trachomatis]|nr:Uncharacterised protein [Chlamydia trachomatis]CPR94390.1 Uncharacterised protein [Chlamydia trachomatis]